jgi:hypothetical protein
VGAGMTRNGPLAEVESRGARARPRSAGGPPPARARTRLRPSSTTVPSRDFAPAFQGQRGVLVPDDQPVRLPRLSRTGWRGRAGPPWPGPRKPGRRGADRERRAPLPRPASGGARPLARVRSRKSGGQRLHLGHGQDARKPRRIRNSR